MNPHYDNIETVSANMPIIEAVADLGGDIDFGPGMIMTSNSVGDVTVPANLNALSIGPITQTGTVTLEEGTTWHIL